jgi:hypothetical protein
VNQTRIRFSSNIANPKVRISVMKMGALTTRLMRYRWIA